MLVYAAVVAAMLFLLVPQLGREIFPHVSAGQLQFRMRAPAGTRIEVTERLAIRVLDVVRKTVGPENVAITLGYVGTHPPGYPINSIYLWTSGPQEAVMQVGLRPGSKLRVREVEERLRKALGTAISRHNFFLRARRHRQPGHGPGLADAGRNRHQRIASLCGSRVRGARKDGTRANSFPPRS